MRPRPLSNPPNPWASTQVEYQEGPPDTQVQVFEDATRSILARNDSPDVGFTWSVNPYRGCMHGCAYCYARPSHEYLSFGAGTDFDTKIVIKPQAPALLRQAFDRPSWRGELVMFSGNTDCYQPLEATYQLTRGLLEVCAEYRNPCAIITKAPLIERDLDLLQELVRVARVSVSVSLAFWDPDRQRALEPHVATPLRRIRTIERLARAGIPVGVMVGPIIPGLNDNDLAEILTAARSVGATHAGHVLLRLPGSVAAVFEERLRDRLPLVADKVLHRIRETRGGDKLSDPRFGSRMVGEGPYAATIHDLFETMKRKLDYVDEPMDEAPTTFRRPHRGQLSLFDMSST
jgi:DNA repair photolyase